VAKGFPLFRLPRPLRTGVSNARAGGFSPFPRIAAEERPPLNNMTMDHQREEEELRKNISPEEKAYLASLERNLAEGGRLAKNAPGSKRAGGERVEARPLSGRSEGASISEGAREVGSIMALGDGSVGIYRGQAPGREHKLVYFLDPSGALLPQGIALEAYEVRELGVLPKDFLEEFQAARRWSRDALVFHLKRWTDVKLLPPAASYDAASAPAVGGVSPRSGGVGGAPQAPRPQTAPVRAAAPAPDESGLRLGQRVKVKFGDRDWHAVYWGADEQGPMVAHCTNKKWALMHLDLKRFRDNIVPGEMLAREEIMEIARQLQGSA
jgi:hypothetical protein